MSERLVFGDLVGPDRQPTPEEDEWLTDLARSVAATELTVSVGVSRADEEPEPILRRDLDGWRAGRYVGELRFRGRTLEIKPRLSVETLAGWAAAALGVRVVPRMAEHGGSGALVAELLAASWRSAVTDAARHGLPGLRAERRHESPYVRGRIDVPGTVRLRAQRRPLVASIARPKEVDNPVSRVIVLAERVLDRRLRQRRPDWRGERLEEIMPRLRGAVGTRPALPRRRELADVRYTPITLPYRRVARLSYEIARHRGLRATATGERAEGLLIDVAELWELFLVHCARRAFGSSAVRHGTRLEQGKPLLHSRRVTGARLGRLFPDLLVGDPERPIAVIDAKYKPLADPRGVDREDLYQLTSYLSAHTDRPLPLGMLGYPRFEEGAPGASAESRGPWASHLGHEVRFERLPVERDSCVAALARVLDTRAPDLIAA